jgi:L-rhamnose-H+ transport protein
MSLGMGVALGYCAAFGTLVPPVFKLFIPDIPGPDIVEIALSFPGQVTLAGVAVCLLGIGIAALAGLTKEKEMPAEEKKKSIAEFSFGKGILVATFSGIMSACFSFALTAGTPIGLASAEAGTSTLWTGLPKLIVVLLGGFTTNFVWCVILNIRNKTGYQYFSPTLRQEPPQREDETIIETALDAPSEEVVVHAPAGPQAAADNRVPLVRNFFFSALAGTTWYFQFFFYTMGETQMGDFSFASWTLHMASIIIFSTLWGVALHEWKGSSKKTHVLITIGLAVLVLSTIIVGYGNYLKATPGGH